MHAQMATRALAANAVIVLASCSTSVAPIAKSSVALLFAPGRSTVDRQAGTSIDRTTDATLTSLTFTAAADDGFVAGMRAEYLASDKDLLGSAATFDSSLESWSLFPHLAGAQTDAALQTVVRVGPEFRAHTLDLGNPSNEQYRSYGLALEIEPQWTFLRSEQVTLQSYARLHGGVGFATTAGGNLPDHATTYIVAGEVGLRMRLSYALVSAGYTAEETRYNHSEANNLDYTKFGFGGAFLSVGVTW